MKHNINLVLAALACGSIVGCRPESSATTSAAAPIKVVAIVSTLGKVAAYGEGNKAGIEAAVAEINAGGGVKGRKIEVTYEDTDGSGANAASVARRYLSDDSVVALLGPTTSDEAFAISNLLSQTPKPFPMLSVGSTGAWKPNGGKFGEYDFRSTRNDAQIVPEMMKIILDRVKPKKVAVLFHPDLEWSMTTLPLYRQACADRGIPIVEIGGSKAASDWSAQLTQLKGESPDLIVMNIVAGVLPRLAIQARDMGIKAPFAGTAAFAMPKAYASAKDAVEGSLVGEIFDPSAPEAKAFVDAYQKANAGSPPSAYAAYGYAGVTLLAKAMESGAAPGDRKAVREALSNLKDVPTVLGTVSYKGSGDITPQHAHVLVVKNGVPSAP